MYMQLASFVRSLLVLFRAYKASLQAITLKYVTFVIAYLQNNEPHGSPSQMTTEESIHKM